MDEDTGYCEEEGPNNSEEFEFDPLAVLGGDLALCLAGISESRGQFCSDCTCQLQYHLSTDDGGCELCLCEEIVRTCMGCGRHLSANCYAGTSYECIACVTAPRIPIKSAPLIHVHSGGGTTKDFRLSDWVRIDREKAARQALVELTE